MEPYNLNNVKIVFIGAGNVATYLSKTITYSGSEIGQVYSRSIERAKTLANQLNCDFTTDLNNIKTDADVYIFAVPDDVLPSIVAAMPPNNGLWVHTSGSVDMEVFGDYTKRYGVFYPLQTFSIQRMLHPSEVSLFIEANSLHDYGLLYHIGGYVSDKVYRLSSEKRKYLHLAAVFACNFSNHLYTIAAQILDKEGLDWRLLQPLIDETAHKLHLTHPVQAQTGPAIRGDKSILEKQITLIEDEQIRQLYSLISNSIQTHPTNKNNNDKL